MTFTCIECEDHYEPDINGDAEERMCFECLDGPEDEPTDEELTEIENEIDNDYLEWLVDNNPDDGSWEGR
jgi:hypothetical protein